MLKYTSTTVFNTDTQAIVNTVNCVGVMGAGLALEFKLRYPKMYTDYVIRCRRQEIRVGKVTFYKDEDTPYIINFPTKNHWKYPSKLEWIEAGLQYFVQEYPKWGITSVAFPKLGCDRGGLDWSIVNILMAKYLEHLSDLDVYICLDNETIAQGIEKEMLDLLHDSKDWQTALNISPVIIQNIRQSLPIQRFRNLDKIQGINKEAYRDIFQYLYNLTQENNQINPQIFSISDLRIRLIMFFDYLGFNPEEISQLKVNNFRQEPQGILIISTHKKPLTIPLKVWQKLQINLLLLSPNQPLIYNKKNPRESLKTSTIKKLIRAGKKILINYNTKQLSLPLNF
jgi:O-acetyl-ADP-ribose deacetylase (regulator of RNase III)